MPWNRVPEFPFLLSEWMDAIPRQQRLAPVYLGGSSGSSGGTGQPPGGFVGQLSQLYSAYDTDEFALSSGTDSLLDNLNHIRYWQRPARSFQPRQGTPVQNRIYVESGVWTHTAGSQPLIFSGSYSPAFTSGSVNQVHVLYLNTSGSLLISTSTSTTPVYPGGTTLPIAEIYLRPSSGSYYDTDQGVQGYIYRDVRPFLNLGTSGAGTITGTGVVNRIPYFDSTTNLATDDQMRIILDTSSDPIIVVGHPDANLFSSIGFSARIQVVRDGAAGFTSFSFSDTAANAGFYTLGHARGTHGTPTPTISADILGRINVVGWQTSGSVGNAPVSARFEAVAAENYTSGSNGTYWSAKVVKAGTATLAEALRIESTRLVHGVSGAYPDAGLSTSGIVSVSETSTAKVSVVSYGAVNTPLFSGYHAYGTTGSPTAILNGGILFEFDGYGYNGSGWSGIQALIQAVASENWTSGSYGTQWKWFTTANGSSSFSTVMTLDTTGTALTQYATPAGSVALTITAGAHTAVITEKHDVYLNLARTVTFTHLSVPATERAVRIAAPTYATNTLTDTITTAATFYVSGAPAAGTGITITNPYAIWVDAGLSQFDGGIQDATLTSGRVVYVSTNGRLVDSANLVFDGTNLDVLGSISFGSTSSLSESALLIPNGFKITTPGGARVDFNSGDITFNGTNVVITSTNWIGLGAGKGRIAFTDAATDSVDVTLADLNVALGLNVGTATGATTGQLRQSAATQIWNSITLTAAATGTIPVGTGTSGRVAYWSGTNALTSDADMTFDGTHLTVAGGLNLGSGSGAAAGEVKASGDVFPSGKGKGIQSQMLDFNIVTSTGLTLTTTYADVPSLTATFSPSVAETVYVQVVFQLIQDAGTAACNASDVCRVQFLVDGAAQSIGANSDIVIKATGAVGYLEAVGWFKFNLTAASHTIKAQAKNDTGARGQCGVRSQFIYWRVAQ